jgi:hypothetical protein
MAVAAVIAGCGKGSAGADAGADAGAGASASAGAGASASAGADAGAGACRGVRAWAGGYRSAAGTLYVPPTWKGVTWKVPETPAGIGEGTIALDCDGQTGRMTGTVEGVLGPATLRGILDDGGVTATVVRTDPSDHGFTGTFAATIAGGHARGAMKVSLGEASAIRVATFDLTPAGTAR